MDLIDNNNLQIAKAVPLVKYLIIKLFVFILTNRGMLPHLVGAVAPKIRWFGLNLPPIRRKKAPNKRCLKWSKSKKPSWLSQWESKCLKETLGNL